MSAYFATVTCPECNARTIVDRLDPYDGKARIRDCRSCGVAIVINFSASGCAFALQVPKVHTSL